MQKKAQKILLEPLIYVLLQKSQFAIILCVGYSALLYYNPKKNSVCIEYSVHHVFGTAHIVTPKHVRSVR